MEPTLVIDPELPIAAAAPDIAAALLASQVVIVAGETGSGKTTQLPKLCLMAGRKRIGHTQPRRIAARTLAERIAEETKTDLGDLVGYQVRFTRQTSASTQVKVMTDGILLAEISHDRLLRKYDTIILDEAHERSLTIDFLLGYLRQLVEKRPDLKVIVTSATIDTQRFSEHFKNAPIVEVSGRSYPVEVRYRPVYDTGAVTSDEDQPAATGAIEKDLNEAICDAVTELAAEGPGDILVFASGEREIRDAIDAIERLRLPFTEVLPLTGRLSAADQHRVFAAHTGRRVVVSTNVAETSVTVPGIRYVVDSGTARISRYSKRTKVQRLPIEPISQASANQRAGRCGRVAPGICIRLYSEVDFEGRPQFTEPEILRTNLASVILHMAQARLGSIATFPFVDPPDSSQVTDGMRTLAELGALADRGSDNPTLTQVGMQLARFPVDPRLGRILVEASRLGCLREALVVVAGLAIPDIRERPLAKKDQADALHRRFFAPVDPTETEKLGDAGGSDFVALVRIWDYLKRQRKELSGNAFRRLCRDEFLNYLRYREWQDLHGQLRRLATDAGLDLNAEPADYDRLHIAALSGLLSHVGLLDIRNEKPSMPARKRARLGPREYRGARGTRWAIAPGSGLARQPPELAVAYELVETTRLWARTVAAIKTEWIEEVGAHALTRQYAEPHWEQSRGSVVASETVHLYGLPIISGRRVQYGRIDPVVARAIFIQSALVEGKWRTRHHFVARNQALLEQLAEVEQRRRRDFVVDDAAIFEFFDARVPADVVSQRHFDSWWRTARQDDEYRLDLSMSDVVDQHQDVVENTVSEFPDQWRVGGLALDIDYVFDPGTQHDGVTVEVDLAVVNQLPGRVFSWQVPGYRTELATELIRSLPKALRTSFVPAPNHAAAALAWLAERPDVASAPAGDTAPDTVSFEEALSVALRTLTGTDPSGRWRERPLPSYLEVTIVVTDAGTEIARGNDLAALQQELAPTVAQTLTKASSDIAVTGATSWSFPTLPRQVTGAADGASTVGFAGLVDETTSVGVAVFDTEQRARSAHARGLRRLLLLTTPDPTTWVVSRMSNQTKLSLGSSPYPSVPALLADCRARAIDRAVAARGIDPWQVRDADAFAELSVPVREQAADLMRGVVDYTAEVLQRAAHVHRLVADHPPSDTSSDVTEQVSNLVFDGFVAATGDPWFSHLARYVHAAELRLTAYWANPGREAEPAALIDDLEDEYAALVARQPPGPLAPDVARIGWMLEELRVGLFAQQLRTSETVSAKRVRKAMAELR